jgi:hypothetical protein
LGTVSSSALLQYCREAISFAHLRAQTAPETQKKAPSDRAGNDPEPGGLSVPEQRAVAEPEHHIRGDELGDSRSMLRRIAQAGGHDPQCLKDLTIEIVQK